jgi:predicted TIM-barrel fold metal-dependent hydrolase
MIIDSDAHVCEARDLFTERLSSKYRDHIPVVRFRDDLQQDWWFVGDKPIQGAVGSVMAVGPAGEVARREDYSNFINRFDEQHPSSYDPNERVKIMDQVGIQAATTYPWLGLTGPDVYRSIPGADLEFQMDVVAAYNDWIMTWATEQPGRFIPLACIPYWDVPSAVREIERCAAIGIKGLIMSGKPQNHGCALLADRSWDPMWAAAEEAGFSISFHASGGGFTETINPERQKVMGQEAMIAFATTAEFMNNAVTAMDLLMSGVLHRYPKLNFAIVESGVGWVPFALETLDEHYLRYKPWRSRPEMAADVLPSDLFHRQVFVNCWYENLEPGLPFGNLMFETDYPHPTCLFGDEVSDAIEHKMTCLTDSQKEDVLWRNAMRCFNLEPVDVGLAGS